MTMFFVSKFPAEISLVATMLLDRKQSGSASAPACSPGQSCRSRLMLLPTAFPLLPLEEEGRTAACSWRAWASWAVSEATGAKHVNVLQHLMGYLKNHLSSEDKQEMLGLIEDYRQGLVPLIVPLTLLKHHLGRYPVPDWVHQQVYLNPYPKELMLRNHV